MPPIAHQLASASLTREETAYQAVGAGAACSATKAVALTGDASVPVPSTKKGLRRERRAVTLHVPTQSGLDHVDQLRSLMTEAARQPAVRRYKRSTVASAVPEALAA